MRCGLLGRKLGHSYSPQIHSQLGDYSYELIEREPEELEVFFHPEKFIDWFDELLISEGFGDDVEQKPSCKDYVGLNVTVPYKKSVIPYLDAMSDTAQEIGAVNTIVRRNGKLIGHNTDYAGFFAMVVKSRLFLTGKKVLVLGSGGASNTAVAVLKDVGAKVVVISRSGENNYDNLHRHADAAVIVNTTPVGMYPNTEVSPIDLAMFPHLEGVLDVIYNPARTKLLQQAEELGLRTVNGLLMLVAQAKEAAEWFSESWLDDTLVTTVYRKLRLQMENIVLIGMPGCGKTTVGRLLAQWTGKTFVDSDEEIVRAAGKSIPEIFAEDGEAVFREYETKVLSELGKQSGLVIATGGGCVTRAENLPSLRQNGTVFWIQRDLALLPTDGRPLSQLHSPEALYATRRPLYETFADFIAENSGTPDDTAGKILSIVEDRP